MRNDLTLLLLLTFIIPFESRGEGLSSKFEEAASSIPTATQTWNELDNLYRKARETGETATQDVYEWAREDINRIGAWEYRIEIGSTINPASLEERLNTLGSKRWECFQIVSGNPDQLLLFLKRPVRSHLKSLPLPSLWNFLPKGDSGGQPPATEND